jgi:CRISPR-associated protein (TIGR02584 family)
MPAKPKPTPHSPPRAPRSPLRTPHSETVLLAVTGMSPAVLTETIWALARPGKKVEPVIPDRVVVVTTLPGKDRIEQELFAPVPEIGNRTVWDALRLAILGPEAGKDSRLILADVRVICSADAKLGRAFPLEDIRTPADNEIAADFLVDEVRRITANPDTTLIASLAGGRKTMGALLYAALSLLGRSQDRLTHVLVSEPFEDPSLTPRFYFPAQPEALHHHHRTGAVHSSNTARLWLADVPFVRLRQLFPKQLGRYPGSFSGLVHNYSEQIAGLQHCPELALDLARRMILVNGRPVILPIRELGLFAFLLTRAQAGEHPFERHDQAYDPLRQFLQAWSRNFDELSLEREKLSTPWSLDDIKRLLSNLRRELIRQGCAAAARRLFPLRGPLGFSFATH